MALPPLVMPRMINLTTAAKPNLKSSTSSPVIDLTAVNDDTHNEKDDGNVLSSGVVGKQTVQTTIPATTSTTAASLMNLPKPFSRSHSAAPAPANPSKHTPAATRPHKPLTTL
jgi:hypothetical protein